MFKYLRVIFSIGYKLLWIYFHYIVKYARHPERYPLEVRYKKVRELFVLILDHFRLDWKIKGLDYLRQYEKEGKTFLLTPNHLSDLDGIAILYWCEKPVTIVAKKETRKFPFVGKTLKAIDAYFLDRSDLRDGVKMLHYVQDTLSSGKASVLIYPEGTRNREPNGPLLAFHAGSLKSIYRTNVPVIGIAQYGSQYPLQGNTNYKRYPMYLTFLKPYEKEDYLSYNAVSFASIIEQEIAKEVYAQRALTQTYFLVDEEKVPLKGKKAISIQ